MNNRKAIPVALGSGALTGFIILGLGSLLVSFGLTAAYDVPMGPVTGRRLLEPVLLGTFAGGLFAIPLVWLHRRIPEKPVPRILAVGITPFALSLLLMLGRRPPAAISRELVLTLLAALAMFLLYGFFADRFYSCRARRNNKPH